MKKILEYLRFLLISPEFVILFGGLWAAMTYRTAIREFFAEVQFSPELIRHISLLPSALTTWLFLSGKKILFPDRDSSGWVQQWPNYWKLSIGFNVSIIYSVVFAVVGILAWAMDWNVKDSLPISLLGISLIGAACTFLSVYLGHLRVAEMMGRK